MSRSLERSQKAKTVGAEEISWCTDETAYPPGEASLRILDTPAEERFDRLTRLVCRCLNVSFSLITVLTPDRQWFKSAQGTLLSETPVEISFCVHTLRAGNPLVFEDLTLHPQHCDNPVVCGAPFVKFYAGIPIKGPRGDWVGTLCVLHDTPRQLSEGEFSTFHDFARCVEREVALSAWSQSEQKVLEQASHDLRGSLVDSETRCWSSSAILDILVAESERSRLHQRPLLSLVLRTDLAEPSMARKKAECLRQALSSYQSLGRLGPDSFLLVMPELSYDAGERFSQALKPLVDGDLYSLSLPPTLKTKDDIQRYLHTWVEGSEQRAELGNGLRPSIEARSFGPFELFTQGRAISGKRFRTNKTKLLLAYLLNSPRTKINNEVVQTEFWPDSPGDLARNSFRAALSSLRSVLREGRKGNPFLREGNWTKLTPGWEVWSDVQEFERLRESLDEVDLSQAMELVRGEYLEGEYEDWVFQRRENLSQAYLDAAHRLAQQAFSRGDFARSAQVLEKALESAPDRQDLLALLFRSWLRLGRFTDVTRRYDEVLKQLDLDFGVEPSLELTELHQRAKLGLNV